MSQNWDETSHHLNPVPLQSRLLLSCSTSWLEGKWETRLQPRDVSICGWPPGGTAYSTTCLNEPSTRGDSFTGLCLPHHPHHGQPRSDEKTKSQKLWWWWVERAKAQEQLKRSFSAEDMTVSTACRLLLGLKGQGHEAAVLVQRSDPRSWPSHWSLVSSGRTLQLEGSTSKPWLCTRAKSVAAEKGPFDVGGAKSAAWESRWADLSLWALTCLVLTWPSVYWEMCLNLHTEIIWGVLPWDSVKPGQQSGDFLCQCSETGEISNWWNVNKPKGK